MFSLNTKPSFSTVTTVRQQFASSSLRFSSWGSDTSFKPLHNLQKNRILLLGCTYTAPWQGFHIDRLNQDGIPPVLNWWTLVPLWSALLCNWTGRCSTSKLKPPSRLSHQAIRISHCKALWSVLARKRRLQRNVSKCSVARSRANSSFWVVL